MASYKKTTLDTLGWNLNLYDNQNAYKETLGDFDIPNWSIDNFNRNDLWKGRYQLASEQTYNDLSLQQKETLRKEIFDMWSEGIWEVIRMRIGLKLDVLGYHMLNDQQQNSLKLAIAYQINYWRTNLPYEVGATVTRISTNIQTTINASEFLTGFDALSARTRTAIVNAGLETYSLSNLVKNVYREDYLITEMNTLKEDISDLKTSSQTWSVPNNLLTRVEAANLYEPKNVGYITEINADAKYATKQEIIGISDGGYYDTQRVIKDSVIEKKLESTSGEKLVERKKYDEYVIELSDNNDNIIHTLSFDSTGLKIDNNSFLNEGVLNSRLTNFYTKSEYDTGFTTEQNRVNSELTDIKADITDINSKYLPKTGGQATGYITSTKTSFTNNNQLVTKKYVDDTLTGTGQFNPDLYYSKTDTDDKFYTKIDINDRFYSKIDSDARFMGRNDEVLNKDSLKTIMEELDTDTMDWVWEISKLCGRENFTIKNEDYSDLYATANGIGKKYTHVEATTGNALSQWTTYENDKFVKLSTTIDLWVNIKQWTTTDSSGAEIRIFMDIKFNGEEDTYPNAPIINKYQYRFRTYKGTGYNVTHPDVPNRNIYFRFAYKRPTIKGFIKALSNKLGGGN